MMTAIDTRDARILIVDDQQANVLLLEQILSRDGYSRVSATTDPKAVCALHQQYQYDLILLDLQMPQYDGFQVMEDLKAQGADDYLPVIVLTAQPSHKLRALQAGAKDFISKPFDLVEVKLRIHNMLEVRLLHRRLEDFNRVLEQTVLERTAELRESEARYRSLTELASDWYWEQDENGHFTKAAGPVLELLGTAQDSHLTSPDTSPPPRWDEAARNTLRAAIAAREPFLDYLLTRTRPDGSQQLFRVSGEPMFNPSSRFLGYRGIGIEVFSAS